MKLKSGFTLTELLVVLVVVLIVTSLVLGSQYGLDDLVGRMACQANLLAIHNVFMQYCANNAGYYPDCDYYYGWNFSRRHEGDDVWESLSQVAELKDYGANADMFFCPMDPDYGDPDNWRIESWEDPLILYNSWSDYY